MWLPIIAGLVAWGYWAYTGKNIVDLSQENAPAINTTLYIPRGQFADIPVYAANRTRYTRIVVRNAVGSVSSSDAYTLNPVGDGVSFVPSAGSQKMITLTDNQGSWQVRVE